jgi:hypothetical protein
MRQVPLRSRGRLRLSLREERLPKLILMRQVLQSAQYGVLGLREERLPKQAHLLFGLLLMRPGAQYGASLPNQAHLLFGLLLMRQGAQYGASLPKQAHLLFGLLRRLLSLGLHAQPSDSRIRRGQLCTIDRRASRRRRFAVAVRRHRAAEAAAAAAAPAAAPGARYRHATVSRALT